MKIEGIFEKEIFYKNGFLIGIFFDGNNQFKAKGNLPVPKVGMKYSLEGKFEEHPRYGCSFSFQKFSVKYPESDLGLKKLLISNIPGIGPSRASMLIDELNVAVENGHIKTVIDGFNNKEILSTIMGEKISNIIADWFSINQNIAAVMIELDKIFEGIAFPKKLKSNLIELYGTAAAEYVKENPYRLLVFKGVGFLKADKCAMKLGLDNESGVRLRAAIYYVYSQNEKSGNTILKREICLTRLTALLGIPYERLEDIVCFGAYEAYGDYLGNPITIFREKRICKILQERISKDYAYGEPRKKLSLDCEDGIFDDQIKAISTALLRNTSIITGAPGTGKTFSCKKIIDNLSGSIAIAAPTGKAAARISELTGMQATTIHRLLTPKIVGENKFEFSYNETNKLPYSTIIIDETSMVDVYLLFSLLVATEDYTRLIFIGDSNQLPSVGAGNVLADMIKLGVPSVELTQIKRQEPGDIIKNCHQIKNGEILLGFDHGDFRFCECKDEEIALDRIIKLVAMYDSNINESGGLFRKLQILSPCRSKTLIACENINIVMQKKYNFGNETDKKFWIGDRVINCKNDYSRGIVNGDMGFISDIDSGGFYVDFESPNRNVFIPKSDNNLDLAYCITCHKFQGSESDIIIFPIHKCFGSLILQRNWLYTAISRAKKTCHIVGQYSELTKTIGRNNNTKRNTVMGLIGEGSYGYCC